MTQLRFQYLTADEHFLIVVPSGRAYRLRPHEFEFALLQAERMVGAGADELVLEAPGVVRLRLADCSRATYERTARMMRETWHYHENAAFRRYGRDADRGTDGDSR